MLSLFEATLALMLTHRELIARELEFVARPKRRTMYAFVLGVCVLARDRDE